MASRQQGGLRSQVLDELLARVERDDFPSSTMLDMIEGLLRQDPAKTEQYTRLLLDRVKQDNYPSMDLLRRLYGYA